MKYERINNRNNEMNPCKEILSYQKIVRLDIKVNRCVVRNMRKSKRIHSSKRYTAK